MISIKYNFIYIHVPKTAGNSTQENLLPFSDDHKQLGDHRDGVDRYELKSEFTPHKHAMLREYESRGVDIDEFKVIAGIRHPVDRCVSAFFSPNRWMKKNEDASWSMVPAVWDEAAFMAFLAKFPPMCAYLETASGMREPDYLIRFDQLILDYRATVTALGLSAPVELPFRNRSAADANTQRSVRALPEVRETVAKAHAADFERFGYLI